LVGLSAELETARVEGREADVRRLQPLIQDSDQRRRDTEAMAVICEAVTLADAQPEPWRDLNELNTALYELLFRYGADGVGVLEAVESEPGSVTLVGRVDWVATQADDLPEATFTFDENSRAITGIGVRAGVEGGGDVTLPSLAQRPENDADWSVVIRAPSL
jgi:hypothetical protein